MKLEDFIIYISGDIIKELLIRGIRYFQIESMPVKQLLPRILKGLFWNKLRENKEGEVIYAADKTQKRSSGIALHPWLKMEV
jgi:hypothetical protein